MLTLCVQRSCLNLIIISRASCVVTNTNGTTPVAMRIQLFIKTRRIEFKRFETVFWCGLNVGPAVGATSKTRSVLFWLTE